MSRVGIDGAENQWGMQGGLTLCGKRRSELASFLFDLLMVHKIRLVLSSMTTYCLQLPHPLEEVDHDGRLSRAAAGLKVTKVFLRPIVRIK